MLINNSTFYWLGDYSDEPSQSLAWTNIQKSQQVASIYVEPRTRPSLVGRNFSTGTMYQSTCSPRPITIIIHEIAWQCKTAQTFLLNNYPQNQIKMNHHRHERCKRRLFHTISLHTDFYSFKDWQIWCTDTSEMIGEFSIHTHYETLNA